MGRTTPPHRTPESGTLRAGAVFPSREDFHGLARQGNLVPITREILADLETPVSAFLKVHRGPYGFLLESVEHGEKWGRYSFLGTEPARVLRVRGGTVELETPGGATVRRETDDPFGEVKRLLKPYRPVVVPGLPRFTGGAVGYVGYDMVRAFERLPDRATDDLAMPDACLMLVRSLLVFDNMAQKIKVVAHAHVTDDTSPDAAYDEAVARVDELVARLGAAIVEPKGGGSSSGEVRSNLAPEAYQAMVRRAKEYVYAGDVIQVVLAQRFELPLTAAPLNVYRCLRTVNPSPYHFFLALGPDTVAGASPEVMARVEDGEVTVRPIAGTRPRGTVEREDAALAAELLANPKEIAEHVMLVDLARNDVGRVSEIGSVAVTERMIVERYSHVMHLVSNVRGKLAPDIDAFDAFRAAFPAGTLSGAPKVRAMQIIEELEPVRRGFYGGAVGYFAFGGAMDTAIAIRSVLLRDGRAYIQAGAGIVADSDPEAEHRECVNKARAVIQAVRLAEAL
ncbi:MAG: anthranilate synthase component I [Candidatus Binatia bacterium]